MADGKDGGFGERAHRVLLQSVPPACTRADVAALLPRKSPRRGRAIPSWPLDTDQAAAASTR
jgi:hypothetical protein